MNDSQTCATVVAHALEAGGIRHIFGHPGGEVLDLIEALDTHGIEFILTGHESTAAFMAGAVGRLTGAPGACLATLGPGACNLVLGVGSAYLDRDPLIAFSGQAPMSRNRISNKQNLPLNDLFSPVTKWSVALEGAGTAQTVGSALTVAATPPRGPVYLSIPSDAAAGADRPDDPAPSPPALPEPDDRAFDGIVNALNAARRPIGVVGVAMQPERDAPAVRRFFEETGIPYVVTVQSKGIADEEGERYLGTVAPGAGEIHIIEWLKQSDCLIGVGFDPVESSQGWHFEVPFHAIADAPVGFDQYRPPAECVGDVSRLIDRLREAYHGSTDWTTAAIHDLQRRVTDTIRPSVSSGPNGLSPYHLVSELRKILPEDTILSADVGAHKNVVAQVWRVPQPRMFLMSNGMSSMGYAMATAIAAALLRPEQPVVSITGDGAFRMMAQELETVRRIDVAPLFIVLCDASLAVIKIAQKARGLSPLGVDFMPVDWVRVAEGFGVRGTQARTMNEVSKAVEGWLARREAMVLAVALDETLYKGLR